MYILCLGWFLYQFLYKESAKSLADVLINKFFEWGNTQTALLERSVLSILNGMNCTKIGNP